jgi:hypothetical protein
VGSIARRIERAEERLGMDQGPIVITLTWFGGEPVPPEERRDNVILRHVGYETTQKRLEGGAKA